MIVTYDYELFLGLNSGELEQTLILPTERIIEIHRKTNNFALFFIDTIYIHRLKEVCFEDYIKVINQLSKIVKEGHFIYPHLHGHWHDAVYDTDSRTWKLENLRYYRFESLPIDLREFYFKQSIELIQNIVGEKYAIDSYRAGGWTIQPFDIFKPHFLKFGIKNEYSVLPGKKNVSNAQSFDFSQVLNTNPYQFENDVCKEDIKGQFTEYPISTITFNSIETWMDFKLSGMQKRFLGNSINGNTVNVIIEEQSDVISPIKKRIAVSFEGMNFLRFLKFVRVAKRNKYFQTISHPKLLRQIDLFYMALFFRIISK